MKDTCRKTFTLYLELALFHTEYMQVVHDDSFIYDVIRDSRAT